MRRIGLVTALLLAFVVTGCASMKASMKKPWGKGALAGAAIGAFAGGAALGVAANQGSFGAVNDSNRGAAIGIGIASGAAIGAVVGHMLWDREPPAPIKVAKKPEPKKAPAPMVVLKGTNFEFNSAALTPDAKAALAKTVDSLKGSPEVRVTVSGYTDNVGPDSYNLTLSKRRAEAVKSHLVAGGIDAARIETQGFGAASPVADNSTAQGRAANRRVEVHKVK